MSYGLRDDDGNDERFYWGPEDNMYDDEIEYEEDPRIRWIDLSDERGEVCPMNCDLVDTDHSYCKAVAERLYKYSQPTEKKEPPVDFEFLEWFEKQWKFWLHLKPNSMEGDNAPAIPAYYIGAI